MVISHDMILHMLFKVLAEMYSKNLIPRNMSTTFESDGFNAFSNAITAAGYLKVCGFTAKQIVSRLTKFYNLTIFGIFELVLATITNCTS